MRTWAAVMVMMLGCNKEPAKTQPGSAAPTDPKHDVWGGSAPVETFVEARRRHKSKLVPDHEEKIIPITRPVAPMQLVQYDAPPGKLWAYLSAAPQNARPGPAIVWITGGNSNQIDDVWTPADPENDQTARQYRDAGIVTMYPSLRGGHDNPGRREGFFGEIDDVLAATAYLAKQPGVDPKQVYLGGHSSGGTLVLLTAAAAPRDAYRAVIAFGPANDLSVYPDLSPYDTSDNREVELRIVSRWINDVALPTLVIEGERDAGNIDILRLASKNKNVAFFEIAGKNHFSVLAPTSARIAKRIVGSWKTDPLQLDF